MSNNLAKELSRMLTWLVAEMSFIILSEHPGESLPAAYSQWERASIEVQQPVTGVFTLAMESRLLQQITGAIYGLKIEEITGEKQTDTLLELVNTFAGRCLKIMVPVTTGFQLGLPMMSDEPVPDGQSTLNLVFCSDQGCLSLSLIGDKLIGGVMR